MRKATLTGTKAAALALWTCVVTGGCAANEGQDPGLRPPAMTRRALTVRGRELRDALDRAVLLRGYGAGGRAKMPPFLPFDFSGEDLAAQADGYFAALRALGANMVRLVLSWEALEHTRGSYDAAYLERFTVLLDAAHNQGLAVVVDFHQDVFAAPFCGDGFPLWALGSLPHGPARYDCGALDWGRQYFDSQGPVAQAFDRLWSNADGLQDRLEAMWRHVAARLARHPAVAGFEVMNEPYGGSSDKRTFAAEILPTFYERMGRAIQQAAGAKVAIFGGGPAGDPQALAEHLQPPRLEGFVYAPHYYDAAMYLGIPHFSEAVVRDGLKRAFAPAARWGVPGFLGEYGAPNDNNKKGEYVGFVLDVLDELRLGAALWEASVSTRNWNHEDFSVLDAQGRARAWANASVRGYPRAVAGEITHLFWSRAEKTLSLQVRAAREGITEVYWPARRLGVQPAVAVRGARWRWLPDRELLLLAATPEASFTVELHPAP